MNEVIEVAQIIVQIKTFEELRFINQDINCNTINIVNLTHFTEEEKNKIQTIIDIIKSKQINIE